MEELISTKINIIINIIYIHIYYLNGGINKYKNYYHKYSY